MHFVCLSSQVLRYLSTCSHTQRVLPWWVQSQWAPATDITCREQEEHRGSFPKQYVLGHRRQRDCIGALMHVPIGKTCHRLQKRAYSWACSFGGHASSYVACSEMSQGYLRSGEFSITMRLEWIKFTQKSDSWDFGWFTAIPYGFLWRALSETKNNWKRC